VGGQRLARRAGGRRKDGALVPVEVYATRLVLGSETVDGAAHDITLRRENERFQRG
jgi:hypothetical protein